MKNVVNMQNFTHYPELLDLIKKSEQLFRTIQIMETVVPLHPEEKLFIEAIIGLNYQASRLQAVEQDAKSANEEPDAIKPAAGEKGKGDPHQLGLEICADIDSATSVFVETASKLSHSLSQPSPKASHVLNWVQSTESVVEVVKDADVSTDAEENETYQGSTSLMKRSRDDLQEACPLPDEQHGKHKKFL
jgi:hypothetical protein